MNRYKARLWLVWWFVVSLVRRTVFFLRGRRARDQILARYRPDGIFAITEGERAAFPSYQKCLACSLCTLSCSAIRENRAPSSFEPKYLLLASARSARDSEIFREEWLPCAECQACTVECPNDVPIHAVVREILDRRRQLGFRQ
jgi:heterodisulfide reductase subunit C